MGSCNVSFLKNTRVEINPKLKEKSSVTTLNRQTPTGGFRVLTLDIHSKLYPHSGTRRSGVVELISFFICCSTSKRFDLQWKTFHLPGKMVYFMGSSVAEEWTASWSPSWILLRIANRVRSFTDSKNPWVKERILELTGA